MSRGIVSIIVSKLPTPLQKALKVWWLRRLPSPQPQLKMSCELATFNDSALPRLPNGYRLENYTNELNEQWRELLNAGNEFGALDAAIFGAEILQHLCPQTVTFVVYEAELVACAAACALPAHLPCVTLSYVVVRATHRGLKLGEIVTAQTMLEARKAGFSTMILQTDDERLAAIKTYLKLGFIPVMDASPDAAARWEKVSQSLKI